MGSYANVVFLRAILFPVFNFFYFTQMSSKLFVSSISWDTTDEGLKTFFSQFGTVVEAKIIMDRERGRSRGFGFVTMGSEEEAKEAMEKADGQMLDGRAISVKEAQERPQGQGRSGGFQRRESRDYNDAA